MEIVLASSGSDRVFMPDVAARAPKCLEQQRTTAPGGAAKMRRTAVDYMT